jgi:hypothetical protein
VKCSNPLKIMAFQIPRSAFVHSIIQTLKTALFVSFWLKRFYILRLMKQALPYKHLHFSLVLLLVVCFSLAFPATLKAQQEEVLLTLRHPATGHIYINCLYDYQSNVTFLPVTELFSRLEINYEPETRKFTIRGNFITSSNPYVVNLQSMRITLGKESWDITPDDFRIGTTDYFLSPQIFEEIFGLNFTVNMIHLYLSLETTHILPVQERKARERNRNRMESRELLREDYPLGYDRKRSVLGGTMVDYSITGNYTGQAQSLGYNLTGGMEVLGGDLQGTLTGFQSASGFSSMYSNGLRWRYAIRDNDFISGIMAGQLNTTGLQPLAIKGLAITNDPIEPRRMYETYVIDGNTEPESEVEIYINERLTDYTRADELGYYRFDVPVTYGTTRISLRIFTPSGEIITTDRQLQVPFTFLPRGVVSYNLQAGKAEDYLADSLQNDWVAHGNVALGVSHWLTASAGAQHLGAEFFPDDVFYYGSLSARIAKQYLLNLDVAPENYYRMAGSVMYTSNLSLNFNYTRFDGPGIFNAWGAKEELSANIYLPFSILGINSGLRIGGEHTILENSQLTRFRADLSSRLGRVNLRLNYRGNLVSDIETGNYGEGILTTALTYTISRSSGIPVYARGMFVRGLAQYDTRRNQMQTNELQLSKTIFNTGRLNMGAVYNYISKTIAVQLGFTLDLNKVRSTTTVNSLNREVTARQSLNGSVGWDMPNRRMVLNNRQQVGRSAASVLLFVDNNNSGTYDAGDQLVPLRGVKLDRTATMEPGRDTILRITQLQSYYKYNLSINRNAFSDPTLVPLKNEFSFIADPNQYKRIEIPCYRGGIIEGMVLIKRNDKSSGQGGLRLILKATEGMFEVIIRSFSDGGFYAMDLPPGKYTLGVDPTQLGFLGMKQEAVLEFEILAKAEGDYLEGLKIILIENEPASED